MPKTQSNIHDQKGSQTVFDISKRPDLYFLDQGPPFYAVRGTVGVLAPTAHQLWANMEKRGAKGEWEGRSR